MKIKIPDFQCGIRPLDPTIRWSFYKRTNNLRWHRLCRCCDMSSTPHRHIHTYTPVHQATAGTRAMLGVVLWKHRQSNTTNALHRCQSLGPAWEEKAETPLRISFESEACVLACQIFLNEFQHFLCRRSFNPVYLSRQECKHSPITMHCYKWLCVFGGIYFH